jgi:hypothetical protein
MNSRNHYFRDEQDNRTVIITVLLPTGEYRAELEDQNDIRSLGPRGYGHTRLAAIADLNEILKEMAQ